MQNQGRIQNFGNGGPVDRVAVIRGRNPSPARGVRKHAPQKILNI